MKHRHISALYRRRQDFRVVQSCVLSHIYILRLTKVIVVDYGPRYYARGGCLTIQRGVIFVFFFFCNNKSFAIYIFFAVRRGNHGAAHFSGEKCWICAIIKYIEFILYVYIYCGFYKKSNCS